MNALAAELDASPGLVGSSITRKEAHQRKETLWCSTPHGDGSDAARVGSDARPAACPVPASAGSAAKEGVASAVVVVVVVVVSVCMVVGGMATMDIMIAVSQWAARERRWVQHSRRPASQFPACIGMDTIDTASPYTAPPRPAAAAPQCHELAHRTALAGMATPRRWFFVSPGSAARPAPQRVIYRRPTDTSLPGGGMGRDNGSKKRSDRQRNVHRSSTDREIRQSFVN